MEMRKFLSVTLIVTFLSLLGSLVNFIAQAVIAQRFGVSLDVDGYVYALSMPVFLSSLIASLISYIAAPIIAAEHGATGSIATNARRLSGVILLVAIGFAGAGLAATRFQPLLLPIAPALRELDALHSLIRLSWLLGALQIVGALATTSLTATGRPVTAALLAFPTNMVAIAALLLATNSGIEVAIAGMAGGALVSAAIGLWIARGLVMPPQFRSAEPSSGGTICPVATFLWSTLALSCFSSYVLVDAVVAARLGEGALATMGFAYRMIVGFGALVVAGPSALIVPRLVHFVAAQDVSGFRRMLVGALGFVALCGLLLALTFNFLGQPIVQFLFERGRFSEADSRQLAAVVVAMAPGLMSMLVAVVSLRALFCLSDTARVGGLLAVGYTASYAIASYLLLPYGLTGIGYAYSISWTLLAGSLLLFVWHRSARLGQGIDQGVAA